MKTKSLLYTIAFLAMGLLQSCGGSGSKSNYEDKTTHLEYEKNIGGPLSDYFEVVNAIVKSDADLYSLTTTFMVEVKRTDKKFSFDPNNAQYSGVSAGKRYTYSIIADVFDEMGLPLGVNLNVYGYDYFEKLLSLSEDETTWLRYSIGSVSEPHEKAKKMKFSSMLEEDSRVSSTPKATSSSSSKSSGKNWDKIITDYESYVNKSIELLKKANAGDMSAMSDYATMLEKAEDLQESLEDADDEMTTSQMQRFIKIQQKLINAVGDL